MEPEFLGYDPQTGLAVMRDADGIITHVDAQRSAYAQEVIRRSQEAALMAKPRDAQGLVPAPGLRDTTIAPRPPNQSPPMRSTPYATVPNSTISPSAHAARRRR